MKSFFLLLLAGVLLTFSATAQTAVAKIKYEEAEEAFTQGEYATTLTRLNEAEKILGATNPRILYLRIMATDKVVQAEPYGKFAQLQALRKYCAFYLTKYENLDNNEDKYRDVYKVSESLKQLMMRIRSREYVDSLVSKYKFKSNLSIEEFWAYNPASTILSERYGNSNVYGNKDAKRLVENNLSRVGPFRIDINSAGKVRSYTYCFSWETTAAARDKVFYKFINDVKNKIPAQYIKTIGKEEIGNIEINVPDAKAIIQIIRSNIFGEVAIIIFSS